MSGNIRLGCHDCDRQDFDGVSKIPKDWTDIMKVQSLRASRREVDPHDRGRSVFEWYTHLGTCPECQREEESDE